MSVIEMQRVSKRFRLEPDRPRSFQDLLVGLTRLRKGVRRSELFWALRDVSFSAKGGETLGIIGENGSGKSTCLKLLTRILEPTTGSVEVHGRVSALLELGAGFHPELTGRENLFLYGSVLGLKRRDLARRFDDVVAFAELERFIDIPVKFYSSGMYVRLAFAAAINVNPEVLLVDEVLAVGDLSFQNKCLDRIHELESLGVTIVFVSHSLDSVRNLCDRALWLDGGILREDGPTDLVIARYLQHVHEKEEAEALAERAAERAAAQDSLARATKVETLAQSKEPATEETLAEPSAAQVGEPRASLASGSTDEPSSAKAASAPDSHEDPMARYRQRWGSREAEIVDVRFLDREGHERLILTTGEPMTVALRYKTRVRIEHPMFGLAMHRNDGLHINGPNNILASFDIPAIEGHGEVRYTVDVLPLLEGTYYLTVALYDTSGTHAYDHHALSYTFRVQNGNVAERYGAFYLPAHWAHSSGNDAGDEGRAL